MHIVDRRVSLYSWKDSFQFVQNWLLVAYRLKGTNEVLVLSSPYLIRVHPSLFVTSESTSRDSYPKQPLPISARHSPLFWVIEHKGGGVGEFPYKVILDPI